MYLNIDPKYPKQRQIDKLVEILRNDGVIIFPTDSVYALGCMLGSQKAADRVCRLKGIDPTKANLTFMCGNISQISDYTQPIYNEVFRLLKSSVPGPVTFILKSSNKVPKMFKNKKRTIGARIPDHLVLSKILESLGVPMVSTSLKKKEGELEFYTDMEEIRAEFENRVDLILEAGVVSNDPSAIIDCTKDEPELIRSNQTFAFEK
jgi:tRNA threonylcarbamoyl adenosine modification protein (Sua5/YciO/YrdC/YwlC family)